MPIYRNKNTGKEVVVLAGTRMPRIYELVEERERVKTTNTAKTASKPMGSKKTKSTKKDAAREEKTVDTKTSAVVESSDEPAKESES